MNKLVKSLYNGLFDFKCESWIKQVWCFMGFFVVSIVTQFSWKMIGDKTYFGDFQLLVALTIFIGSAYILWRLMFKNLERYFAISAFLLIYGFLIEKPVLVQIAGGFLAVCLIIQGIHFIGEAIDLHKKEKKKEKNKKVKKKC